VRVPTVDAVHSTEATTWVAFLSCSGIDVMTPVYGYSKLNTRSIKEFSMIS
jgi:hypothetical protein